MIYLAITASISPMKLPLAYQLVTKSVLVSV